jgi:hypothetical protein
MKSGFVPKGTAPDELIAGTERGGQLPPESDPEEETSEEREPSEVAADSIGA